ncbi:50S ribosomal protein L25/general stress protein Ctc [Desulfovibrio sp. OttesenSCG-928-F20]|nr:50S ribosomal protein L25/general stress protein Ctc [Desulfovibrio sp. OttesenSCG-928-F20]
MSEQLSLTATTREKTGKNANRRLRARGVIPAVFYTANGESKAVQVNEAELNKLYLKAGRTSLFNLVLDNGKSSHPCLIWDAEYYPTKARFQHVDFYGVDLDKALKVRVPLEFIGTAKGTKLGGKLETYREQIFILSKPADLPKKITVDISGLEVGQGLRVADLTMPQGVQAHYDSNFAIISVAMPGAEKDEAADDEAS